MVIFSLVRINKTRLLYVEFSHEKYCLKYNICMTETLFTSVDGHTSCAANLSASGAVQENEVITMTCSVAYSGNWAPTMRWFNSRTGVIYTVATVVDWTTAITSQLTVTASAGLHGSQIACVTYFTQPSSPLQTSATNIPSYTNTWTSPTLDVQCKVIPL